MNENAPQKKERKQLTDHYLVGIGASAGGLEAIHKLFDHLPNNSSFSFIIIQHLSPDHKSLMAELLTKHTRMQVQEAEDKMLTRPNCVYVLPSGKQLTIEHGRLRLADKARSREPNFAIDLFFESMAKERGRLAVGVVLSGTGTDGTKGAIAIKAAGGMVVVQDPKTAKFDGMPRSAIDTGAVDFVLPPEQMPEQILDYTQNVLQASIENTEAGNKGDEAILNEILDLICSQTKTDFTNYKRPTIERRLSKRMEVVQVKNLAGYLSYLRENPTEVKILSQEFLIGVTRFFRDNEAFEVLEKEVIPAILAKKDPEESIKVWVAACSTGEEAYSLAMLFQEHCRKTGAEAKVKIFATDIDSRAISFASKGIYPASIAKEVSPDFLKRYFYQKGNKYVINEDLRKLVVFAQHDLQKDPPFSKIDLVTCRNMLIYLNPNLQNKVLSLFPYALNMGGYLMLGPSEHIGDLKSFFVEENRKWKLYQKVKDSMGVRQNYGISDYTPAFSAGTQPNIKNNQLLQYSESFMDAVADDFRVTGLYVDESYQLLHGIGDINRFLKFPKKRLQFNLLKMVPDELAVSISVGIRKALKNNQNVPARQVAIKEGNKSRLVQVSIKLIAAEKNLAKVILVLLQEVGPAVASPKAAELPPVADSDYYQQLAALEMELKEARDSLHLTVQDLSTSNEELQSSNEELMSSNEELQSSNEEMQSLNEELHTVNTEHQLKIKELQELNEDLDNYIRSSNIGQVFLDHNLEIRKFTPSARELINIMEGDLGRPIHHLSHNLKYTQLTEDIRKVNHTSVEVEQEVETTEGKYFLMRVIPYLKHDGNKDGVVLSFVEVTTLKALSNVVQGVLNSSLNSIMAFKVLRDAKQEITDFIWSLLNHKGEELIGKSFVHLSGENILPDMPFIRKSGLFKKFVHVVESGQPLHIEQQLEIRGTRAWYEIAAVKMGDGVAVTMANITEKKNTEEKILLAYEELKKAEENLISLNGQLEARVLERTQELAASEERFRLVSMATNDVVWDWDLVSNSMWWSDSLEKTLGFAREELAYGVNGWFERVHPEDREAMVAGLNQAINYGKEQWSADYRIRRADDTYAYVSNRAYIMHNEYKVPYRILGSFIDLSNLKETQEKLQSSNAHLLKVNADLDTFVYTASHDLKAPIANIEGLLLLLEDQIEAAGPLPGEPTKPVFDMVKDSISRFKNVIKDLTDIAKVQRDVDGAAEQVDLLEILENVKGSMKDWLDTEKAQIVVDFKCRPKIKFSTKNMHSVLYNLINNAVKYKSPDRNPEVRLKLEQQDHYLVLSVQDNGLGMSSDNLSKMFTLFKRFHSHVEGTGMGLYIVKRIMNNAGGKVNVASEEGVGTTFKVYFKHEVTEPSPIAG
ncbi:chemotaxis protein CheB [Pontibacter akesuensis]|uniref:Two-component system, chemotaxis family, CheB/CheR fusion protein n=1 Tax=Pontibacter akesuensis TaxID=388950 RepID=A0A1I7FHF2_9BACT|nr:chemotaxis protein CheB [Pontibacter akesuensis]GHA62159.1 hypothetical protein GCM10007389_13550 [Pontibacter akesuensis]SFU35609.1 two-component system, chemotaxis family, CheB/CheR fusion protein [Pontibacter akesuensis]